MWWDNFKTILENADKKVMKKLINWSTLILSMYSILQKINKLINLLIQLTIKN